MKYYIYVIGCDMNKSDAERLSTILDMLGYKKTNKEAEANILIAVCCSVRLSATNRIFGRAREWRKYRKKGAKLLLTGCVLKRDKIKFLDIFDDVFKIDEMGEFLPKIIEKKQKLDNKQISNYENDYFSVFPNYESFFRAYVPIMTGCNNFCSYCAVPYVRGREKSRLEEDIIKEIKKLISRGYKEIILLGQNVNSYGANNKKQIKKNKFVDLLKKIDRLEGKHRIYFYSNHPKDVSDELIETLPKLEHFPKYIHLPLQSGSDEILKKMNRHYTKKSYLELVNKIRKTIPDVVITTDIIVSFPGETENQFNETKNVMEEVGFDMAFTAQYSERPGTKSADLEDDIPREVKKSREYILQKETLASSSLSINKKLIGTKQRVLIDSKKNNRYFGRTDSYKVVEIKTDQKFEIGQFYEVEIIKAETWKLLATLF